MTIHFLNVYALSSFPKHLNHMTHFKFQHGGLVWLAREAPATGESTDRIQIRNFFLSIQELIASCAELNIPSLDKTEASRLCGDILIKTIRVLSEAPSVLVTLSPAQADRFFKSMEIILNQLGKTLELKQSGAVADKAKELADLMKEMSQQYNQTPDQMPDKQSFPPEHKKYLSPSMDEMKTGEEAKEKGLQPVFTIEPPLQGYFRSFIADRFNPDTVTWIEENSDTAYVNRGVPIEHTMSGKIRGKIAIPLPAGYTVNTTSLKAPQPIFITFDNERGITYFESATPQEFSIGFGPDKHTHDSERPKPYHGEDIIIGRLSDETEKFLRSVEWFPAGQKAITIAAYVKTKLDYSNESRYNAIYKSCPEEYFQQIEQHKKADCDVANTYFAALCRRAKLSSRLVVGHHVPGSKDGKSHITHGTGHAWAEIFDGSRWLTIDAQPEAPPPEGGEPLDAGNPEVGLDLQPPSVPKPPPPPRPETKRAYPPPPPSEEQPAALESSAQTSDNEVTLTIQPPSPNRIRRWIWALILGALAVGTVVGFEKCVANEIKSGRMNNP